MNHPTSTLSPQNALKRLLQADKAAETEVRQAEDQAEQRLKDAQEEAALLIEKAQPAGQYPEYLTGFRCSRHCAAEYWVFAAFDCHRTSQNMGEFPVFPERTGRALAVLGPFGRRAGPVVEHVFAADALAAVSRDPGGACFPARAANSAGQP